MRRVLAWLLVSLCAWGGEAVLHAVRVGGAVHLDGRLDEGAWALAPVCGAFVNTETQAASPVRNTVRVLYDEQAVYLGIWCEEPQVSEMKLPPRPRDGGLFQQDSVEIMLDPGRTQEVYWHFMVGAQGTLYDAYRDQGIGIIEEAWNGVWAARSYIGDGFWSCEVKIPFFNFARRRPLSGEWGVNVIRNRRTSQRANYGIAGVFHEPTKFWRLTGVECDLKPYQVELAPLTASTGVDGRGQGYMETATSIANFTGAAQVYTAENYVMSASGEIAFSKPVQVKASAGQAELALPPTPLTEPGEYVNMVRVADAAGRVVAYREAKTEVGFTPISIRMLDPHYRYTVFATQKLQTIALDMALKLPEGSRKDKTLAVAIGAAGQAPVWERKYACPEAVTQIRIPNASFPEGRFRVEARLLDATGVPVKFATACCPLWKLPYKAGETWLSKDGRIMREGKPIFTIRTKYGWMPWLEGADVHVGMNGRPKDIKQGELWISGDIIYRMGGRRIPEFRKAMQTGAFDKQHIDQLRGYVRQYREVPELLAWLWFDEPSSDSLLPSALEALYEVVKEEDPYHPVWGSDSPTHHYVQSMDVHEHHPYPAVRGPRGTISDCRDIAYKADSMRHGQERLYHKTALGFTDMGINKWDWRLGFRDSRIPSVQEFHNQLMMAIAVGCNHIQCYGNEGYCYPEVYVGWFGLVPEMRYVGDHAVQERHPVQPECSGAKDVRRIATDTADGYFLVASNVSMDKCRITFTGLPRHLQQLHVVAENRTVAVADGVMSDDFGPCEGRAYVEKAPPALAGVAVLSAKVEEAWRRLAKPGNLLFQRGMNETVELHASSVIVNHGTGGEDVNLWHVCDGTVPGTSGGYGLLLWTSHPEDRTPWLEVAPKRRPFALGRVVIDTLDHSLAKFHVEVFASGAWKTVYTCADGTRTNHFECAFPPVPNAERFRIVVEVPAGKLSRPRYLPQVKGTVARIGEVEAYAQ